jgi:hypothetical protein
MLTEKTEPNLVVVSDKDLVHKIMIEWDLPKAEIYKLINAVQPDGVSLVTVMDKEKHRQRVSPYSHLYLLLYPSIFFGRECFFCFDICISCSRIA